VALTMTPGGTVTVDGELRGVDLNSVLTTAAKKDLTADLKKCEGMDCDAPKVLCC